MGKINDLREKGYSGPRPFQVDYLNGFGKRKRVHFKTKPEAERFLKTIEAEVLKAKEGLLPDWFFNGGKEDLTVRELYNHYVEEEIDLKKKQSAQITAKRHLNGIVARFGNMKVGDLSTEEVGKYRVEWRKSGRAENSFQTYIKKFKAMLSWGVENGYIAANPLTRFKLKKRAEAKKKPLDEDQIKRFILALKDDHREILDYFILGINTGMRISEMWTLEWNQVDIEKRTLSLPEEKTKTNAAREVPLNNHCMDVLNRLYVKKEYAPFVLWHPPSAEGITKRVKKLSRQFLGKSHTPHFWRVTFATRAFEGKEIQGKDGQFYWVRGDQKTVAEIGGWDPNSKTLVEIYQKVSERVKRETVQVVGIGESDTYPEPRDTDQAIDTRLTLTTGNA